MLIGTYARTLDAKHRLSLPPALRLILPVDLYCLRASEGRLILTPDFAPYPVPPPHVHRVWLMDGHNGRRGHVTRWTVPYGLRGHLGARVGDEVFLAGDGGRVVVARTEAQLLLPMDLGTP